MTTKPKRKRKPEPVAARSPKRQAASRAFFRARAEARGKPCPVCGILYDDFKVGLSFAQTRRDIIAIGTDRRTGKTKYGRRNGTLGFMREQKQLAWKDHLAACAAAAEAA